MLEDLNNEEYQAVLNGMEYLTSKFAAYPEQKAEFDSRYGHGASLDVMMAYEELTRD